MTNGLVQHITVELSTSIQWFKQRIGSSRIHRLKIRVICTSSYKVIFSMVCYSLVLKVVWVLLHFLPFSQRKTSFAYLSTHFKNSQSRYFGMHSHSASLFCQKPPDLPILRAFPYFYFNFKVAYFRYFKFYKHSPMEIVKMFGACAALLKKFY